MQYRFSANVLDRACLCACTLPLHVQSELTASATATMSETRPLRKILIKYPRAFDPLRNGLASATQPNFVPMR